MEAYRIVESGDYIQAIRSFNALRFALRVYYMTRGKDFQKLDVLFFDAIYDLQKVTNNHFKKEIIEEDLTKITEAIRGEVPTDPNAHLSEILEDIQHSYGSLADNKDAASDILDCFDEINSLKDEFKENIHFSMMMQYAADTKPLLVQVSIIERPPAAMVMKLTDKFSAFSVAAQRVLVPPVQQNITREKIVKKIQEGVPIRDIADDVGITEKELREMLEGTTGDENHEE